MNSFHFKTLVNKTCALFAHSRGRWSPLSHPRFSNSHTQDVEICSRNIFTHLLTQKPRRTTLLHQSWPGGETYQSSSAHVWGPQTLCQQKEARALVNIAGWVWQMMVLLWWQIIIHQNQKWPIHFPTDATACRLIQVWVGIYHHASQLSSGWKMTSLLTYKV